MKYTTSLLLCAVALASAKSRGFYPKGAGNDDPRHAPAICAAGNSDSILIAHEKCNKFYICAHGQPVPRPCPNHLLFNPNIDRCDYPEDVDCGDRIRPNNGNNNQDTGAGGEAGHNDVPEDIPGENGDNGNTGSGNGDPSQAAAICAAENSQSILVAHENCNKFYICTHGKPVVLRCLANLFFNPKTDKCDYPENVDCGDRNVPGNDNEGTQEETPVNPPTDGGNNNGNGNGNTGAGNCDPSKATEICAAEGSDSVLVAHEKCNKFYKCTHGVPVPLRCPGNLFFNPNKDWCDEPDNVDCGNRITPGNDNDNEEPPVETPVNPPTDNEDNGNTGAGNCDPSQAPQICAAEGSDSILVAHEKCNKFYICAHGFPVAQRCPANLFFNPNTDRCDEPGNVDCGDRIIPGTDNDNEEPPVETPVNPPTGNEDNGNTGAGNCDPSQAPQICAAEGSDSILVAHEKCNKFYICAHGFPVAQRCPANLFFNPNTDRCDEPGNVDCGDRIIPGTDNDNEEPPVETPVNPPTDNEDNGNTGAGNCDPSQAPQICAAEGSDSILVAHEKCNKFYICAHGFPVAQRCPANLFFNPNTDRCDEPGNVDCGDRIIPGTDNDNEEPPVETPVNPPTDNEDNGNTGAGNCDPSQAPQICAAEGSDSILVAHEKCNKFYICAHGFPVAQRCPANLFFNPNTDRCDEPGNVDCGDRIIPGTDNDNEEPPVETPVNPPTDNEDNGNTGAGNCDPSQAPQICAAEGSDSILVAHEKCNKFYICAHGFPVAQRCPANLFFNPNTDRCDEPGNVDCGDRIIPGTDNDNEEPPVETPVNPPTDNEDNGNTGAGNCDPSQAPQICAAEGSDSILVAHEKCNKFYICAHGFPVAQRCPANLFFNPNTDRCDEPGNVDCGDRIIPGTDNDNEEPPVETPVNPPTDNEDNGNTGAGNCDPSQAPQICAAEGSDSILVAHEKCNKFYICAHGFPVAQRCPANLFFNPNTDRCDEPGNVDCGDRIIPGTDNDNEEPPVETPVNPPTDNEDNGNTGAGNCDPSQAPQICAAEGSDSILVAHEKCNKFYICAHGFPVAQRCPANLFFNPNTDRCDEPGNVDCGDRIIPGTDNDNEEPPVETPVNPPTDNEDNGNTGAGNCDPSQAPQICAAEGSDSILVAHEKCNKFYKCANGVPVPLRCPGNLFFNPNTDECDYFANVDCGNRIVSENDNEEPPVETPVHPPTDNDDNDDNGNTGAGNCDPSQAPQICAAEGSDSILVAHEKCNKFYKCANGVPVPLRCPGNLFFNPNTDECDYFDNVDCGNRIVSENDNVNEEPPVETPVNPPTDNDDNGNTGSGNCDPSQAPQICAAEGSDSILVAHEKCNKFYKCANGVPVPLRCPGNLFFNPNTDECDYFANVDCGNRIVSENDNEEPPVETPVHPPTDNDDNDDNGNTGAGNCDPSQAPQICAAEGSDSILVAHEKCNKFYKCANGVPVPLRCPGNLFFNPNTDECDYFANVDCGNRIVSENDNEEPPVETPVHPPSDNDDNDDNGNTGAGNCDPSQAPQICAAEGSDSILVAHEKCNKFYKCANGVPVPLRCPGNLFFNPITDECDYFDNVNCGNRIVSENDNNNEKYPEETPVNPPTDNGDDNGNIGAGNCDPSKAPAICAAEGSESILVAHEKCNKFYKCANGVPVPLRCPGNLFFNPNTDECDYFGNVDCGNRIVSENDNGNEDYQEETPVNPPTDEGNGNGNTGAGNCDPSQAPQICAADGSESILVAHEICNKFYKCSNGVPVPLRCPGNLFFNPKTDECDYYGNVKCGDRIVSGNDNKGPESEEDAEDDTPQISEESEDEYNDIHIEDAYAFCAEEYPVRRYFPHRNCHQFFACLGRKPVVETCPPGLLYHTGDHICEWPRYVSCGNRVVPNHLRGNSFNKHLASRQALRH